MDVRRLLPGHHRATRRRWPTPARDGDLDAPRAVVPGVGCREARAPHRHRAPLVAPTSCETREPLAPKSIDLELPDDPAGLPDWLEASAAALRRDRSADDRPRRRRAGPGPTTSASASGPAGWRTRRGAPLGRPERVAGRPRAVRRASSRSTASTSTWRTCRSSSGRGRRGAGETLHLHCTDRDGRVAAPLGAGRARGDPRARQGRRRAAGTGLGPVPRAPRPRPAGRRRGVRRPARALEPPGERALLHF